MQSKDIPTHTHTNPAIFLLCFQRYSLQSQPGRANAHLEVSSVRCHQAEGAFFTHIYLRKDLIALEISHLNQPPRVHSEYPQSRFKQHFQAFSLSWTKLTTLTALIASATNCDVSWM